MKGFFFLHFEWAVLAVGILLMAYMDPLNGKSTFCLFERAGISFCPGEGLGRSIAYLFRGDVNASFASHPAGIPAVLILSGRIFTILKRNKNLKKQSL